MNVTRPRWDLLLLLAAFCWFPARVLAQGDQWHPEAPLPTPRRLLAAAALDGRLYTFGGCGSPCFEPPLHTSAFEETRVEVYDPQHGSWSARKPMPTILYGAAAVAPGNGKIYTFGGYVSGNVVQEYDPAADAWRLRRPMPTPRYGLAAVALDGKIYALGGSGPSAAVEVYDPASDSWTARAPLPTARVFLGAAVAGRKIYAVGGSPDCCGGSRTSTLEIYDPATDSWRTGTPLPVPLQVSAVAGVDGKVYVLGGFVPGSGVQGATFEYDPANDSWIERAPMPTPRDQAPAVVLGDEIAVPGGAVECHCRALSTFESYQPLPPPRPPATDLSVEVDDHLARVEPGQTVRYTLTVRNAGPGLAIGAVFHDTFTAPLIGVAWTCAASGGARCTASGPRPPAPIRGVDDRVDLPAGSTVTYTLTAVIDPAAQAGTVVDTATIQAPAGIVDTDSRNDTDSDTDVVVRPCLGKLGVVKSGPSSIFLDSSPETVTYTLKVANEGTCAVRRVTLEEIPPAGFELISAGAPCAEGFPCRLGTLAAGTSVALDVTYRVPQSAICNSTVANTVRVASDTPLSDSGAASSTATSLIECCVVSGCPF